MSAAFQDVPARLLRWWQSVVSPAVPERRQSRRIDFREAIEIRTESGETVPGLARDLSETGMGAIVFGYDLSTDEVVWIKYSHPTGDRVQLVVRQAKVCARYGYRYGFQFTHPL